MTFPTNRNSMLVIRVGLHRSRMSRPRSRDVGVPSSLLRPFGRREPAAPSAFLRNTTDSVKRMVSEFLVDGLCNDMGYGANRKLKGIIMNL
jgi:hypothetical protein